LTAPTHPYRPVSQWPAKLRPAADFLAHAYALLRAGGSKHPERAKRDALALAAHLSGYWAPKELGKAINVAVGGGSGSTRRNVIKSGLNKKGKRDGLADLDLFICDPPDSYPCRITLTPKGEALMAAQGIKSPPPVNAGKRQDQTSDPALPPDDNPPPADEAELREVLEGEKRLVEYWRRMRDSTLVRKFKDRLRWFVCSGCGVDFEQTYGPVGRKVIQAHHRESIGSRAGGTPTTIDDFDPVCANCHCIMHQYEPALTVEKLRDLISRQRSHRV
jgi:hypothetical protein